MNIRGMEDADDEELQMAFRMSLQAAPEAKRSKPGDNALPVASPPHTPSVETAEARERRLQRELRAAAAEQRRIVPKNILASSSKNLVKNSAEEPEGSSVSRPQADQGSSDFLRKPSSSGPGSCSLSKNIASVVDKYHGLGQQAMKGDCGEKVARPKRRVEEERHQLPYQMAEQLYNMVFGTRVYKDVLAQWCNQGLSSDSETSLGLVQRKGGPCGVLAPIQATLLKYLLFVPKDEGDSVIPDYTGPSLVQGVSSHNAEVSTTKLSDAGLMFSDYQRTRALIRAMGEILWRAGGKQKAVVAALNINGFDFNHSEQQDEIIEKGLQGVNLDSVAEFQHVIRITTVFSLPALHHQLENLLHGFRSRLGALLFLFSALLSRGLDAVQSDRDDLGQPLVTLPFGHASQEIVNLLLCGQAVPNVFDEIMNLGSGMCLKGIPMNVEVGFLTLLEYLHFCKVGQFLKCPRWPIWVVGSESHYSVLFALDTSIQDENQLETREACIRRAFDAQDQSGGGGFISLEALQQLLIEMKIDLSQEMLDRICNSDIVIWNDLWQALLQLDKSRGGLKDNDAPMGKRSFQLYHFNGIAKTVVNSSYVEGELSHQRPQLTTLRVTVPPKWTPDFILTSEVGVAQSGPEKNPVAKEEPAQQAPLVDCIRTRWQRAICNWSGDAPSIV
ncbi:hypothetical protein O6H91_23G000900 [Diphasiastrum complanatum]|uniref:Uncharacterized protein n=1 Tax=Diphasiastrum complanatum TaxID=34168 RepID=A0ACC2A7I4_DIPCM|nr:hypothetical protein O6H91_23G000900 [Diphasiastrum complanatum]